MRVACLLLLSGMLVFRTQAQPETYTKMFFENSLMPGRFFFSQTSYQKPSWVKNSLQKLPLCDSLAFTPGNALELSYTSAPGGS